MRGRLDSFGDSGVQPHFASGNHLDQDLDKEVARHGQQDAEHVHDGAVPLAKALERAWWGHQQVVEVLAPEQGHRGEDGRVVEGKEGEGHEGHIHGHGPDHVAVGPDHVEGGQQQKVVLCKKKER